MVVKNMKNSNNNKNNNNASIKDNSGSAVNDNDRINTNVNIKIDMGQPQIQKPKRRVKRKPKVQPEIPTQVPKNGLAPVPLGATYMPSSSTYDTSLPAFRPTFESTRVPTGIDGGIIIPPPVAPIAPFVPAPVPAPEDGYRLGAGTPAYSDRGAMGSSAPPVFSRELTPAPVSREYTPMSIAPVSREITPMSAMSAMSRDSGVSQTSYGSDLVPYIPPPIGYLPNTFTTYQMGQQQFERPQLMSESRDQSPLFPPRPLSTPRPPKKAIVTPVPRPSPVPETPTIIRPSFPTTPPPEVQQLLRNQADQGAKFNASIELKRFVRGAINRNKLEKINNAVEVLQYQTREFLAKKRIREEDSKRLKALTTLQGYVRKQIQQPENISKNFLDSLIDDVEREVSAEERIQQFYGERGGSGIREVRPEIAVKEGLSPSLTEMSGATTYDIPSPSGTLSGFDENRRQRLRELEAQLGIRSDISIQPIIPEEPMMTERERVKQELLQAQQEIADRMKSIEEPPQEPPKESPKEEEKARKRELKKQAKQTEKELKRLEAEAQKLVEQRQREQTQQDEEKQRQKQIAEDIKKAGEAQKKLDEERRANAQKRREATRRKLDAIKSRQARTIQNAFRNKKAREIRDTLDNLITGVEFQVEEEETQRLIKEAEEEQKRIKTERAKAKREAFLKEEREKAIKLQKINDEVKGVLDDLVNNVELNILQQETEAELAKAEAIRLEQQRQLEELTKQRELEILNQRKKAEELIRRQKETIKNAKTEIEINDIQTEIDETTKHLKRIEETYKKIVKTNKQITEAGLDIITKGKIKEIEFDADEFDKFIESIPNTKKVIDDTIKQIDEINKKDLSKYKEKVREEKRQELITKIKERNALKLLGKVIKQKADRNLIANLIKQRLLNDERKKIEEEQRQKILISTMKRVAGGIQIGAVVRRTLAQQDYNEIKEAITKLQSNVKGQLSRLALINEVNTIKDATDKLQSVISSREERKNLNQMRNAITEIQSQIRRYQPYENYKTKLEDLNKEVTIGLLRTQQELTDIENKINSVKGQEKQTAINQEFKRLRDEFVILTKEKEAKAEAERKANEPSLLSKGLGFFGSAIKSVAKGTADVAISAKKAYDDRQERLRIEAEKQLKIKSANIIKEAIKKKISEPERQKLIDLQVQKELDKLQKISESFVGLVTGEKAIIKNKIREYETILKLKPLTQEQKADYFKLKNEYNKILNEEDIKRKQAEVKAKTEAEAKAKIEAEAKEQERIRQAELANIEREESGRRRQEERLRKKELEKLQKEVEEAPVAKTKSLTEKEKRIKELQEQQKIYEEESRAKAQASREQRAVEKQQETKKKFEEDIKKALKGDFVIDPRRILTDKKDADKVLIATFNLTDKEEKDIKAKSKVGSDQWDKPKLPKKILKSSKVLPELNALEIELKNNKEFRDAAEKSYKNRFDKLDKTYPIFEKIIKNNPNYSNLQKYNWWDLNVEFSYYDLSVV